MPRSRGAATRESGGEPERLLIGGRESSISNPHKVLFPGLKHTKLHLARYYLAVAEGARLFIALCRTLDPSRH